jgi:hypothetical protein
MLAALIVLVAVLALVVGIGLMSAGPSRVRRRVVYTPVRRRRTVVEDVMQPGQPAETRRVVEYE